MGITIFAVSCSEPVKQPPPRETVLKLLQEEAQSLKREGEDISPSLGVTVNWEIEAVEVHGQPESEAEPWTGVIRFHIESRMPEPDGTVAVEEFDKNFEYGWDMSTDRWLLR
ncbi:MAG: hypothetical protein ACE5JI_07520 [Acidobacteriota bacterium]